MKYLAMLATVVVVIAGYIGFWFYTAGQVEAAIWRWQEAPSAEVRSVELAQVEIEGFPFRIRPILSGVAITFDSQDGPWSWQKDTFSFVMQPWQLRHAIADIAGPSLVTDPDNNNHKLMVAEGLASLVFNKTGTLENLNIDTKDVALEIGGLATGGRFERVSFFARQSPQPEGGRDVAFRISNGVIQPHPELPNWLHKVQLLDVDLTITGPIALPVVRGNIEDWRDAGGNVTFRKASLKSPDVQIDVTGSLSLDRELRPVGRLNTETRGYRPIVDDLVRRRKINYDVASKAKVALNFMAAAWGGKAVAPIVLNNGLATLGPLQLAILQPVVE
jgi:hypothetical protein